MRKTLLLIICTLTGCSTPPQYLAPMSESVSTAVPASQRVKKDPDVNADLKLTHLTPDLPK